MNTRRPPAQPPRRQHGAPTGSRPAPAVRTGARAAITAPMQRPKQASPWGRWTPAIAAVAVVTVIAVVASVNRELSADASRTITTCLEKVNSSC